jgi:hypothetical protein
MTCGKETAPAMEIGDGLVRNTKPSHEKRRGWFYTELTLLLFFGIGAYE